LKLSIVDIIYKIGLRSNLKVATIKPPKTPIMFPTNTRNGTAKIDNHSINLDKSVNNDDASIGIRPDDIQISDSGSITCKANLVEYLGSDMIIYSSLGDQEFSCKLSSKIDVKAGNEFKFDIQPNLVHIFDNSSGKRLD